MDLRSIINAEASSSSQSRAHSATVKQSTQENGISQNSYLPPTHAGFQSRPAQPPPLQPPTQADFRSPGGFSSYVAAHSPYSHTPTSSLSGTQYPFPQNSAHSGGHTQQLHQHPQRDSSTPGTKSGQLPYGQPLPSPYTPSTTTPGSSYGYSQEHRSQSIHSVTTPTSAQSQAPITHRGSPLSAGSQGQQFSIFPHHHHSQPGTPLGPPSSYHRSRPSLHQEHSGSFEHHRSQSGSSISALHSQVQSPIAEVYGRVTASPTTFHQSQIPLAGQDYLADRERERSLSVSPKTMLPSQTRQDSMESRPGGFNTWKEQILPSQQIRVEDLAPAVNIPPIQSESKVGGIDHSMGHIDNQIHSIPNSQDHAHRSQIAPSTGYVAPSPGAIIRGLHDMAPSEEQQRVNNLSPTSPSNSAFPQIRKDMSRPLSRDQPNSTSSSVTPSHQQHTTLQTPPNHQIPLQQAAPVQASGMGYVQSSTPPNLSPQVARPKRDSEAAVGGSGSAAQQPTRKRPRHDEPPIFARKASRSTSNSPLLPNKRQNGPRSSASIKQDHEIKSALSQTSVPTTIKEESNGHLTPPINQEVALPKAQPELAGTGPLGPWEPSILNLIPSEEVTRIISDYLFTQVVLRDDVGAGPAGGGPGQGAVLEIEAKIGQLIDKNTNDRLRLPVMSECVVSKDDPNLRVTFKSSMTEAQHRALNGFLNKALVDSQPPKQPPTKGAILTKPRIPMSYVHTKECDAFYELSQAGHLGLPPSIRAQLNPRHRAKVRITTDQKTGKELAKIVKARVADLDIYSPRTAFDWRLSVNLEMNYDGDMQDLVETTEGGKRADRNKDRMSYRHLAYQIDLTQVTPSDSTSKADKEHELEIEVSSAEVRRQGLLVKAQKVSQYEDLIRGFVDNVRVLARHC